MNANELRIGNWIMTDKEEQVCDVLCDSVNTHSHEGIIYDDVAPIPLTEEWLIRFGATRQISYQGKVYDCLGLQMAQSEDTWVLGNEETSLDIDYVHQMQNLYFAIVGEELKIKS